MTQQGFEHYIFSTFGITTGTANSYITAIHIIDEMFEYDDVFALKGKSVTSIDNFALLDRIYSFVREQQRLFQKNNDSIFRNINTRQKSYPRGGFCSAAMQQLMLYFEYEKRKQADLLLSKLRNGTKGTTISKNLIKIFDVDKEDEDKIVEAKIRLGQGYFRKMVLANYEGKCCLTGLNVPQILRASHIVAWAEDKANRMNPENGLCLSATYDAAFDKHLISFDDDYKMIVSKEIREFYTNKVAKEYFGNFEGKRINLPSSYLPNKELLKRHRERLVV